MIIDTLNEYSDSQAVTATAASTNVIDHLNGGDAIGNELYLHILCQEDVATATSITFALQTDTVENFASPTTLFTTAAIVIANLTAGTEVVRVRVPKGMQQYSRVYYTIGGSNATAGKFDAFLSPSVQDQSLIDG
jgi:hypothetical protein